MKVSLKQLILFFLICGMIYCLSFPAYSRGEKSYNVMEGDQAPNFSLKDLNGHNVRLSDYKGRPVLLLFMTTWIRGCWEMIPHMKEFHSLYSKKGLALFNIDIQESQKRAEQFAKEKVIPYPTLLDKDGETRSKFGVFSVPVMILINSEGRIICWDCPDLSKLLEKQFRIKEK
ncbi:MAG TPA: redoxin domain-containing protein [Syntrophales bacterium]|nr:redoxin domain-containing protein [Syntrophales bacterium]